MPFAGLRGHDPDDNQFDLSQKGMANVREGYLEDGWEQPRWINHIAIRSTRPAHLAEFYQKVFELQPVEGLSGDNSYYVTDGKVSIAIRPWDMVKYRGLYGGARPFRLQSRESRTNQERSRKPSAPRIPGSAARKVDIGRDGESTRKISKAASSAITPCPIRTACCWI